MDYNKASEQWKDMAVKNYLNCINSADKSSKEYKQLVKGMEILLKYHSVN